MKRPITVRLPDDLREELQDISSRENIVLHRDERALIGVFYLVDSRDVGVIERGGGFGLVDEPLSLLLRTGRLSREELQRDLSVELRVLGEINHSHPALAELLME